MPRNLSAADDALLYLAISGVLTALLFLFDFRFGIAAAVVWVILAIFARSRHLKRLREFDEYFDNVANYVRPVMGYAVEELPLIVMIIDQEGRLMWSNKALAERLGDDAKTKRGTLINEFWPEIIFKPYWGKSGEQIFYSKETAYRAVYRPVPQAGDDAPLMAFYVHDVTKMEELRADLEGSRTALAYIQIDNYDEAFQGLAEAERSILASAVTGILDGWTKELNGILQRLNDEKYVMVMERRALNKAVEDKFAVLDRAHTLRGRGKLPITLSFGAVASSETQTIYDAARQAAKTLELALARGGDQAAILMDGKTQFFGGKAQAVEKHTRVKARVVAHSLREQIEASDEVYVMGHKNEDFDALGAAIGIARLASYSKKKVRIVLSETNDGVDKCVDMIAEAPEYHAIFIRENAIEEFAPKPKALLVVVDTHIPHMVASPKILSAVSRKVIVDHHRRSESVIETPQFSYIEPSSSSASELVTELSMYYADDVKLTRYDATALYAGIVVDTKYFAVQTGVRTLEAAAYLRRAGADPVLVRQLFREDYATYLALAKAMAASTMYEGGLVVTSCRGNQSNIQTIAAKMADILLSIEGVSMSIVVFQLKQDVVGISARSSGELNVQVIMEEFGGGGHQNVAAAQVKNANLDEIESQVVEIAKKYIRENG